MELGRGLVRTQTKRIFQIKSNQIMCMCMCMWMCMWMWMCMQRNAKGMCICTWVWMRMCLCMCLCMCVCVCDAQLFNKLNSVRHDTPRLQRCPHCSNVLVIHPSRPFLPLCTTA